MLWSGTVTQVGSECPAAPLAPGIKRAACPGATVYRRVAPAADTRQYPLPVPVPEYPASVARIPQAQCPNTRLSAPNTRSVPEYPAQARIPGSVPEYPAHARIPGSVPRIPGSVPNTRLSAKPAPNTRFSARIPRLSAPAAVPATRSV
nr:predicted GPI-anchored protein 58 [Penaeus vannamei]